MSHFHIERSQLILLGIRFVCFLVICLGKRFRHVPLGEGSKEDQGPAGKTVTEQGLGMPQDPQTEQVEVFMDRKV